MIQAPKLLSELQGLLRELEDDLRERVSTTPELDEGLRTEHQESLNRGRTGQAYEEWREDAFTQAAAAWILGCVFVRFLEDNELIDTPLLSGPGDRRQRALDQHELYFRDPERRAHSDRDYLLFVFDETQKLPAAREVFDRQHNPLWSLGLSGDGATNLLGFWQRVDPETGSVGFDFTDPEWNTRFLGDLYQDLSESARKKYALLQTPEFVEEFILDRTLSPAIEEFGSQEVRVIDPTCGSGHFLLGSFHRLFELWVRQEPGGNPRDLAQRALGQVYGVDLNPFAAAIAKFRMLVAALKVSEVKRLADAPAFQLNLAAGDSLLHGKRFRNPMRNPQLTVEVVEDPLRHVFETEDAEALRRILGQQYHAVVGNPPYITVKDKALNQAYRELYGTCYRKYSLAVPFVERFFDLALSSIEKASAGYVGVIVANSFMKREFGKKLIEKLLPKLDLTHVVDTSGAYIPGHGTPTVILFGRHRSPVGETVRAVQGIQGEPSTPDNPAEGFVWGAILDQIDHPGSESNWLSVSEVDRKSLGTHPWSISGGGASELKEGIDGAARSLLKDRVVSIGFGAILGEDDAFTRRSTDPQISRLPIELRRPLVEGEFVRDWNLQSHVELLFPYDKDIRLATSQPIRRILWPLRTTLWARADFSKRTYRDVGRSFHEYHQIPRERNLYPLSIAFAFVATHNHFVLDRGGKVFKQSAPIIKLRSDATEDDHLALLGLLNSSTACFWMKQVFYPKGGDPMGSEGARLSKSPWHDRYEHAGTGLAEFPVAPASPLDLSRKLDGLATEVQRLSPAAWGAETPARIKKGNATRAQVDTLYARMISLQEELDWECYHLYGLTPTALVHEGEPPPLALGQRAFEILMARKRESGELETTWFDRHGSTPTTALPDALPREYRTLVEARMRLIQEDRNIRLIEKPEFKRRWNREPWENQLSKALREWLASRLEALAVWKAERLATVAHLADLVTQDAEFMEVATAYRENPDFDVTALVDDLVVEEAVPFLSAHRFKSGGMRKHAIWKRTWDLQREEDAGSLDAEASRKIPVPPKYASADYKTSVVWRLRGRLDVPKERFTSLPGCEREADPSLVIGWAGWNHLERCQAIAAYYLEMKEQEGWTPERLTPLLSGLLELVPWVKQWHNEVEAGHGVRMGDYFADFVAEESRELGLTLDQVEMWTPPRTTRGGKARRKRKVS